MAKRVRYVRPRLKLRRYGIRFQTAKRDESFQILDGNLEKAIAQAGQCVRGRLKQARPKTVHLTITDHGMIG